MLKTNVYFTAGWPSTDYNPGFACNNNKDPVATTRFKRNIPACFLQSDLFRSIISILIDHFAQVQPNQESVDNIYDQFCNVYYDELCRLNMTKNGRERARYRKPWWCDELSELWENVTAKDKGLKLVGNTRSKRRKLQEFVRVQKQFDACFRRHKRKYIRDKQLQLDQLNTSDPAEFWRQITKLGPRTSDGPPLEVYDDEGHITADINCVLDTWANTYEKLYVPYEDADNVFDKEFFETKLRELDMSDTDPTPDYKNPLHLDVVDRYLRRMGDKTIPDEAPPSLESFYPPWVAGIDLPQSRCCGFFVSFTNKHK